MSKISLFFITLLVLLSACKKHESVNNDAVLNEIVNSNLTSKMKIYSVIKEDNFPSNENIEKLIDNKMDTKYLAKSDTCEVLLIGELLSIITSIELISGNDSPPRDPSEFILEGSLNNQDYFLIDKQENFVFANRLSSLGFFVSDPKPYRFYRLKAKNSGLDEYGSDYLQLSELYLIGDWVDLPVPNAKIKANKNEVLVGEKIRLINESKNYISSRWILPKGTLISSDSKLATITYNVPGLYNPSLEITDANGISDLIGLEKAILVKKDTTKWGRFIYPEVNFTDYAPNAQGSIIFHSIVKDPEKYIADVTEKVCRFIYDDPIEIITPILILNYQLKPNMQPGIPSYLLGAGTISGIDFSADHVEAAYARTQNDSIVEDEILGVLFHEVTHGYQLQPKECGSYDGKSEYWAFIEGLADAVRIKAGYHKNSKPTNNSLKWLAGYTQTGYFYNWLADNYDKKFLIKLNRSTNQITPWKFEKATQLILNRNADELWIEYKKTIVN